MKVLWFSNSPVSLDKAKRLGYVGGGWIESLEKEISGMPNIELGIVIQQEKTSIEELYIDNVHYFICPIRTGRLKRKTIGRVFRVNDEQALTDYLAIVENFKPDIVHIFGTENNYGLIIPKINIPAVIHIQGILTMINNKYYTGLSAQDVSRYTRMIDRLKGTSINQYYRNSLVAVKREQKILTNCKFLIGRTNWDKRASAFFAPQASYFHCDEMLRKDFFSYHWKNPISDRLQILSVLRSNIYKGFDLIIRTSWLLSQRNINFQWNIAGASAQSRDLQIFLKKYKYELSDNINFVGSKNSMEIINLMSKSNIFIHTSYIENSPNSVCEAMLAGMPVIANYSGGIPSLLESEKEGILLQEGDPFSMASAILEIGNNPEKAIILGENARKRALQRHHPETIVNTLLSIYQTVFTEHHHWTTDKENKTRKIITK
jgi:glycosyltransferase involved in cell wall biosynthesis